VIGELPLLKVGQHAFPLEVTRSHLSFLQR
jgi:hypothetical protein